MKKLMILMMMAGLVATSACASNEANMESAENDAEMANEKAEAAVDDAKASAEEAEAEASDAAAKAEADAAEAKAEAEEAMTDAEDSSESAMAAEAAADSSGDKVFVCKNGDQVRTISLIYNDEGSEKICQVDYEKASGVQTLWTAILDTDYCREKAEEFVQKQEGWGWDCAEQ